MLNWKDSKKSHVLTTARCGGFDFEIDNRNGNTSTPRLLVTVRVSAELIAVGWDTEFDGFTLPGNSKTLFAAKRKADHVASVLNGEKVSSS